LQLNWPETAVVWILSNRQFETSIDRWLFCLIASLQFGKLHWLNATEQSVRAIDEKCTQPTKRNSHLSVRLLQRMFQQLIFNRDRLPHHIKKKRKSIATNQRFQFSNNNKIKFTLKSWESTLSKKSFAFCDEERLEVISVFVFRSLNIAKI
jgi:hypothetical protein